MVFQRDKSVAPQESYQTGLPPAQSGDDVPRWLAVLGLAAGLTLLVALLRYAIDLLGVVFVIILVGFAIRAVSDWVTEGQSVSVWAISALSLGLTGTVLVGLWLFSSGDMGSQAIPNALPGPIQQTVGWLESKGWGQRVLLTGSSTSGSIGREDDGGSVPSRGGGSASETSEPIRMPAATRPTPAPEKKVVAAPSESRASTARRPAPGAGAAPPTAAPPTAATAAAAAAPAAGPSASPVPVATTVALSSSPAHAVVGSSVRLTAQVRGQGAGPAPTGTVVFTADDRVLGHAQVRGGVATLVTLDLGIGEHTLSATYEGDGSHLLSRSASILQTVARK